MSRYIDAEMLEREIKLEASDDITRAVIRIIDRQPTADVVEVKHGEWIVVGRTKGMSAILKCSYCGRVRKGHGRSNYCPDCGAKMDGERKAQNYETR